ncbi:NAD(P)H-binding protein [Acetobacter farinalis]|uniref:NAD(P)H-binding protein n=1 Tax=Acetobacter farinalis TaxID=1260984 RepID=A0ABT3Q3M7_9PROT|nr:NAD(P)H-binding protein [Acetobacter farinalis]MCX2559898.1 NAD(P)H-binding protein [Acetobacter farinalis]NHO28559.1 NAD(P)H-binding protein [Acetobacter farinalis]
MIIVTGANGQLGRAIVTHLAGRGVTPREIVACVRDPGKAADLATLGVTIRTGDFADAHSLKAAFQGAGQVLIVSVDKLGEEALRLHRTAIEAARAAGARRILYTSHMGARLGSPFLPADQHAGTEADLAASGVAYTSLRHGFYAESCLHMIGNDLRSGELRTPEDGPISWTARSDLAEADSAILASNGGWDGITPPLTAGEAVTMAEIAEIASEVTGRTVRHVTVTDAAWREAKIAAGMPPLYADMLLGTFLAARRGDFAATDPALATLLGRKPKTIRDALSTPDLAPRH